ncbi:MAG: hypothetical protein ACK56I_00995, partial [bacterium]
DGEHHHLVGGELLSHPEQPIAQAVGRSDQRARAIALHDRALDRTVRVGLGVGLCRYREVDALLLPQAPKVDRGGESLGLGIAVAADAEDGEHRVRRGLPRRRLPVFAIGTHHAVATVA